jgi:hypothetical protein
MSTPNAQAGAISFAHLAGITTPVHAAKAEPPAKDDEDDKDDDEKAEGDDDDAKAEADPKDKDAANDDSDEPDDDDDGDKKSKKARAAGMARGVVLERRRWTSVLASKAFGRSPAIGAHLLANTPMNAAAILAALRDAPASGSNDAARSARNPNLGSPAPAVSASTDDRWAAAIKRAGIRK